MTIKAPAPMPMRSTWPATGAIHTALLVGDVAVARRCRTGTSYGQAPRHARKLRSMQRGSVSCLGLKGPGNPPKSPGPAAFAAKVVALPAMVAALLATACRLSPAAAVPAGEACSLNHEIQAAGPAAACLVSRWVVSPSVGLSPPSPSSRLPSALPLSLPLVLSLPPPFPFTPLRPPRCHPPPPVSLSLSLLACSGPPSPLGPRHRGPPGPPPPQTVPKRVATGCMWQERQARQGLPLRGRAGGDNGPLSRHAAVECLADVALAATAASGTWASRLGSGGGGICLLCFCALAEAGSAAVGGSWGMPSNMMQAGTGGGASAPGASRCGTFGAAATAWAFFRWRMRLTSPAHAAQRGREGATVGAPQRHQRTPAAFAGIQWLSRPLT